MSATGRGTERAARDFYPTPAWCTWRLLDRIGHLLPSHQDARWIEPCVGSGAICAAVESWWRDGACSFDAPWTLVDLEPLTHRDAITGDYLATCFDTRFDVAITNPPFHLALEFIQSMLGDAGIVIALLRLNFLGSKERAEFFKRHPPDVYVLPNRPTFTVDGETDNCEYAWFVWGMNDGERGCLEVLDVTPLEVRQAARRELIESGYVLPAPNTDDADAFAALLEPAEIIEA